MTRLHLVHFVCIDGSLVLRRQYVPQHAYTGVHGSRWGQLQLITSHRIIHVYSMSSKNLRSASRHAE